MNPLLDAIIAAQLGGRRKRKEGMVRRAAYHLFYRVLRAVSSIDIPLDSGDFCVMSHRVADVLKKMPEREAFLRGLRAWAGFRQVGIEYERERRAAGRTKYSLTNMLAFAMDGIFSFSILPLRAAIFFGLGALAVAVGWFLVMDLGFCRFRGSDKRFLLRAIDRNRHSVWPTE